MTRADLTQNTLFVLALCVFGASAPALSQNSTFFERGLGEISPVPSGRHQSAIERGEAEMSHRDFEGAISAFSEAIGFNMNNASAYFKRGQCYYYQKKYTSALSDFEYMLKMNPHDTQALLWSGTAQARLGHEEKAVNFYLQAMRSDPKLVTQFQQGTQGAAQPHSVHPENEGAVSAYEKAVALYLGDAKSVASADSPVAGASADTTVADHGPTRSPEPSEAERDSSLNEPELRIEQLDAAIKDDPTNAVLHFRRGVVNKSLGHTDKALIDFSEAIRLDPMKSRFYLARARLYHEQNQPSSSEADIKKAQSVDPSVSRHIHFDKSSSH